MRKIKTVTLLIGIWATLFVLGNVYINMEDSKPVEKKKECVETGFTLISADSAITNCGRKIARKHYSPYDK